MTTLTFTDDARSMARLLEARRTGGRKALARELGCAPGTLENLQRDRLKEVKKSWLQRKLAEFLEREIEAEIRRLVHELELHRQAGGEIVHAPQRAKLVAAIEAAQRLIEGAR